MIKHALSVGALVAGLAWGGAAQAQQRQLIIFGNDKCPENTICVRAPESERYRIPPALRDGVLAPSEESWANRQKGVTSVGQTGTGSCTNVGGGGWTGCWAKMMRDSKAEERQDAAVQAAEPLPR